MSPNYFNSGYMNNPYASGFANQNPMQQNGYAGFMGNPMTSSFQTQHPFSAGAQSGYRFNPSASNFQSQQSMQQQNPMEQLMPMVMMLAKDDPEMMQELAPLMIMSKMATGMQSGMGLQGMMSSVMPLMQMMQTTKVDIKDGSEGKHDESTIKGYAQNAGDAFDKHTLTDEYLTGKALPRTQIKFIEKRDGLEKEKYVQALEGLAESELDGVDTDNDGEITVEEYADAKYEEMKERLEELKEDGEITKKEYRESLQGLKKKIEKMAKTMDFSYDKDGKVVDKGDGILQVKDVAAFFGHIDYFESGKYDGIFSTSASAGTANAAMGSKTKRDKVRDNLFRQHQELHKK